MRQMDIPEKHSQITIYKDYKVLHVSSCLKLFNTVESTESVQYKKVIIHGFIVCKIAGKLFPARFLLIGKSM